MKKRRFLSFGLLIFAIALSFPVAGLYSTTGKKMNVVLIMTDDIGYECFGCYGSKQYKTPRIDKLAEEGMRFTHCHSNPLCTPSRVKIMTGRSNVFNYVNFGVLPQGEKTFGNMFREAGYKTCVAGKWQLDASSIGQQPKEAGFDSWCLWHIKGAKGDRYWAPNLQINGENKSFDKNTYGPDICANFLIDFIKENKEDPFFVYYPMILPHNPFLPTPDSKDRNLKDNWSNFRDMTEYFDKLVGKIADALDEQGIRENTVLIYTSDNGTSHLITSMLDGREIVGGKGRTHRYGTHVPLIVNCPGTVNRGAVCDDLVGFADFLPTLSELTGIKPPKGVKLDGLSFWPQCIGNKGKTHEDLFCYYFPRPNVAEYDTMYKHFEVRFAWDQKYRFYNNGDLYDMIKDPEERDPITVGEENAEAKAARKKLQVTLKSMPKKGLLINERK